jgi:RNA polymerase sigma-70 factor
MDQQSAGNRDNSASDSGGDARYEEFLTLFAQHRERVFGFIYSLVPNFADAEDVFQRCSLVLWRNFDSFDRQRSFLAWACGVAANEVRNALRTRRRDRLRFDDELVGLLAEARPARLERYDERFDALEGCLAGLKAADRELVRVAYEPGARLADHAAASGRALQSLYNRLTQLRRLLLDCVERKQTAGGTC